MDRKGGYIGSKKAPKCTLMDWKAVEWPKRRLDGLKGCLIELKGAYRTWKEAWNWGRILSINMVALQSKMVDLCPKVVALQSKMVNLQWKMAAIQPWIQDGSYQFNSRWRLLHLPTKISPNAFEIVLDFSKCSSSSCEFRQNSSDVYQVFYNFGHF